jgi:hypothetical protein
MSLKHYPFDFSTIDTLKKVSNTVLDSINATGLYTKMTSNIVTLDGSYSWSPDSNTSGYHSAYLGISANFPDGLMQQNAVSAKMIKYNGIVYLAETFNNNKEQISNAFNTYYLTVPDTETGFPDAYSPISADWKAYFYGWKLCASDGTAYVSGTKYWKKIISGDGITDVSPTTIYAEYQPYKFVYQLSTPVVTQLNLRPKLSNTIETVAQPYDNVFY